MYVFVFTDVLNELIWNYVFCLLWYIIEVCCNCVLLVYSAMWVCGLFYWVFSDCSCRLYVIAIYNCKN